MGYPLIAPGESRIRPSHIFELLLLLLSREREIDIVYNLKLIYQLIII